MVTILKNVTNVITAVGEMHLFKKDHDSRVWTALFLMVCSSVTTTVLDFVVLRNIMSPTEIIQ